MTDLIFSQISLDELLDQVKQAVRAEIVSAQKGNMATNDKAVTTKELCTYLNISEPTVVRWRDKSLIPYYQIGSAIRYDLNEVLKAIEKK